MYYEERDEGKILKEESYMRNSDYEKTKKSKRKEKQEMDKNGNWKGSCKSLNNN